MRLLSWAVGIDRLAGEIYMSFVHAQEMPPLCPDVDPTDKHLDIALVATACIRPGKLYQNIDLLDPDLV